MNEDPCRSRGLESVPEDAVAVPVAGSSDPAADSAPEKVAVVPVSAPARVAEPPDRVPVAVTSPVTLWVAVNVLAPVVAYDPAA